MSIQENPTVKALIELGGSADAYRLAGHLDITLRNAQERITCNARVGNIENVGTPEHPVWAPTDRCIERLTRMVGNRAKREEARYSTVRFRQAVLDAVPPEDEGLSLTAAGIAVRIGSDALMVQGALRILERGGLVHRMAGFRRPHYVRTADPDPEGYVYAGFGKGEEEMA